MNRQKKGSASPTKKSTVSASFTYQQNDAIYVTGASDLTVNKVEIDHLQGEINLR